MTILVQNRNFFYTSDGYKHNGSDSVASSQLAKKEQEKNNYESSIESYKSQYSTISSQEESMQSGLTASRETVSLSETAVLAAETEVANSQEKVTLAKNEVTAAKAVVENAQSGVKNAENNVSTAQANVDAANAAVANAQSSLQAAMSIPIEIIENSDGSISYDSSKRDEAVAAAMAELNAAQNELAKAQNELTKAQNELTKAQNELKEAETELKTTETELKTAETELKATEKELKTAETTLKQAQKDVLLQEQKLEQIRAKGAELQVKIGDLEAKISIVEQEYNELVQQAEQQEKEQEAEKEPEEKTQTVNDYMLAAIEAELLNQQSEIETEANSKSGLGKLWDGAQGLFGRGTKGELNQVSEMYEMYNSLKNGADTNAISKLYTKVFSEKPDIDAIEESIKTQESLKEGNFTLEDGQSVDFDDIKNEISSQVSKMSKNFDDSVESQGIISTVIGKVNNFVGIGTTEKMAKSQMKECEKLVDKMCNATSEKEFASYYKALTGEDLTTESLNELFNGRSKVSNTKAAETAMDYESTQDSALNAVSTTVAGIATATLGPVGGFAVGAAVNVGIKALDAATQKNDKSFIEDIVDYAKTDMLKDALVGGASGLSGGVANNLGKAAAGRILQNQVGNIIKNEAGEFLIETAASRITGELVEGAVDGALGNSLEYIVDTALDKDKDFSLSELAETTLQGAGFGSLTSLGFGEATNKIFGSNSLSVKAGDDIKIEGGTLINSRTNKSVSFGDEKVIFLNGESLNIDENANQLISLEGKKPSINIFTGNKNSLNTSVGDMVQLPNTKNIGIKLSNGNIEELNISAKTYNRLFPNGNNVKIQQQNIGDCYLVSSIYSMLSNPETSPQILRCFVENQDGSVSFKLPKGNVEFKLDFNKNMTDYVESTKIVNGSEGVRMIEYTYGLELLDKKAKDLEGEIINKISDYENIVEAGKAFDAIYDFNMENLDLENARKLVDELPIGEYDKIGDFFPEYRESFYSKFITNTEDGISINFDNLNIHKEKYQNILNKTNTEIENLNQKLNELVLDSNRPQELRGNGGYMNDVFAIFGFENSDRLTVDSGLKLLKDNSSNHKYIFGGGTNGNTDTVFLNKELDIVGSHAYSIKPINGKNGEILFEITNPWHTYKHIVINESQLTKYFRSIYYARIA